ncbi:glycosyltransferase family 4 protein [Vibrio alginolyticus]|uniref:glycosyltransferase family 4 protein n=1 Tax=Vibrio alginolyticus TaxID=663 RepID=UPI001BD5CCF7|nr:glycosyltransferase family 4 protein [Vibrio alginolyticus]EIC9813722.1 glycosyltransferase family 4 protein [Vibrio alginolyticus]EII5415210.1 glycosyltransferase family 4 protein [Vibrio alginolyticus]MBS9947875.1 glycosyltransferase family 4 protein [Vibrio alginolyticus]
MRDVVIIGSLPRKYGGGTGGIATHVEQLADSLAKKNFRVTVYSDVDIIIKRSDSFNVVGLKNIKNILLAFVNKPISLLSKFLKKDKAGIKRDILTFLIQHNHDRKNTVIHVHSLHNLLCDDEILDTYKCVYTDHGYWQSHDLNKSRIESRINKAEKVISVSKYAQNILKKDFPNVDENKLLVIYNPIKIDEVSFDINRERQYNFFNGFSESLERKGLDKFVYIAEKNKEDLFIAIADNNGCKFIKDKRLDNVDIHGRCDFNKIVEIYKKSKVMILPSKSESFGLVYLEAAYYGVPVIGFAPVINEFNQYLSTTIGYPYDPSNQNNDDLLEIYKKVQSMDFEHDKISNLIRKKFSWEIKVNEFINAYECV